MRPLEESDAERRPGPGLSRRWREAGIQEKPGYWIPACGGASVGMTVRVLLDSLCGSG